MNIVNAPPIIPSSAEFKSQASSQLEKKANTTESPSSVNTPNPQQNTTPTVLRVAPESLKIAEFNNRNASRNNGRASSQTSPQEQYQATQEIIRREEIDALIGIDLFA